MITLNIIAQPTAVTPNPLALSAQRAAPRVVTTVLPDDASVMPATGLRLHRRDRITPRIAYVPPAFSGKRHTDGLTTARDEPA
ncbi:MAG TPA: hypothetical protein VKE51_34210 [Vicinamibacterales bacterium]|nr:hypothetical protein [Vicinamibacterales bacterium]